MTRRTLAEEAEEVRAAARVLLAAMLTRGYLVRVAIIWLLVIWLLVALAYW